ncbi:porin [Novosphingobium sp. ST904]|uniref:OprO/OprP family phosphate-selective porin n=1 Tax=Novosphingobium sp. ST904 TaxID=1684385 RepID=UPI003260CAAD
MPDMRLVMACATAVAIVLSAPGAHAQAISAEEAEVLRAQIRTMKAQMEAMEARLNAASPAAAAAQASPAAAAAQGTAQSAAPAGTPAIAAGTAAPAPRAGDKDATSIDWKGSPQFAQGDRAFKVKGRIQADANYVSAPGSLDDKGLGFNNEMRRIRLGAEGALGAGFDYKLELELSDNAVDLVDTYVGYHTGPWQIRLGNQNSFQSLDELTGDTSGSVMERAAFTDAFNFERRLGLAFQYGKGPWLAQAGVFTDDISALANDSDGENGGDENNSYGLDGRLVFAPKIGDLQLHFGGSAHWRRLGRLAESDTRYRQRPFVHSTNTRLIGTPAMNVSEEDHYGVEFAAIRGRWHAAAEYHALTANRVDASTVTFQGAYAETGLFLTKGDHRGYKEGIFRVEKPAHPVGEGGIGSVLFTLRYDWLDLNDRDIRGGTQNGYIAALVWEPIQNLRFNVNYALMDYTGAKALPSGKTDYDAQVIGTRFELDF